MKIVSLAADLLPLIDVTSLSAQLQHEEDKGLQFVTQTSTFSLSNFSCRILFEAFLRYIGGEGGVFQENTSWIQHDYDSL